MFKKGEMFVGGSRGSVDDEECMLKLRDEDYNGSASPNIRRLSSITLDMRRRRQDYTKSA